MTWRSFAQQINAIMMKGIVFFSEARINLSSP